MTTISLSIDEIQIAYGAINVMPQLELTKHILLHKLDVESLLDTYDMDFDNAEFEHMRLAINAAITTESNVDLKLDMVNLYDKLVQHRRTMMSADTIPINPKM